MKDAYSFDADDEAVEATYRRVLAAYERIFARLELGALPVGADNGPMGGRTSHEFVVPAEAGEDRVALCGACGYAANLEVAGFRPEPLAESGAGDLRAVPP